MSGLNAQGDDAFPAELDADAILSAAEAAAVIARSIVKPFFRAPLNAESKADESPVTIADRNAESAIRAVLTARFPAFGILGEEFGLERPEARFRWVIDPIDGTRAFITGRPIFGTLIALLDRDRPVLGILDQPITGERWTGVKGRRTSFTGPFGGAVGVRKCPALQSAEMSCTAPDMIRHGDRARWDNLAAMVRRTSWGGDCYAYGLLALGHIDLVAEAGLKIWDWAALQPIIEGAGGRITDWDGAPLGPQSDGRVLAAGDPSLHAQALDYLKGKIPLAARQ